MDDHDLTINFLNIKPMNSLDKFSILDSKLFNSDVKPKFKAIKVYDLSMPFKQRPQHNKCQTLVKKRYHLNKECLKWRRAHDPGINYGV